MKFEIRWRVRHAGGLKRVRYAVGQGGSLGRSVSAVVVGTGRGMRRRTQRRAG